MRTAGRVRVGARQLALASAGITDRDRSVLRSLAAFHFLTTPQIERLHFQEDTRVTSSAAEQRAYRSMSRLYTAGLIDRLDRRIGGRHGGSGPYAWCLSPAGHQALGLPQTRRGPTPGIHHLAHTLDVAELVVRLHVHTLQRPLETVAVETEPHCWRRLRTTRGGPRWLKPDLRLTLRTPGHELHWFVEVDRGHARTRALTHKIRRYLDAWHDGTEQARVGVFPRVLWIVPTPERAAALIALCASTAGVPAGMFVTTTTPAAAIDTLLELPE